MKIHLQDAGYMTKMATMSKYGKSTLKIFFPGTSGPISTKFVMKHRRPRPILFYSNDNPGLTLTYFTAMSNLAT